MTTKTVQLFYDTVLLRFAPVHARLGLGMAGPPGDAAEEGEPEAHLRVEACFKVLESLSI